MSQTIPSISSMKYEIFLATIINTTRAKTACYIVSHLDHLFCAKNTKYGFVKATPLTSTTLKPDPINNVSITPRSLVVL